MSFYTEVIQKDPRFHTTAQVNDLGLLEPTTRNAVQGIISDAKEKGLCIIVGETFRSRERQQLLFTKGVTKLRAVGVHHYGLAADLWIEHQGKVDWHADYMVLGPLAKAHGLVWGYDWGQPGKPHSFRDIDHVQRCGLGDQPRLFAGTWYPGDEYNALA